MAFADKRALRRAWLAFLTLGLLAGTSEYSPAQSSSRRLILNPERCTHLSGAQQKWLTLEWQSYLEYTRVCPVRNSKREAVVLLVSVRADLYYKAQPGSTVPQVKMPNPVLFLPSGEVAGSLPYNFPDDPPSELRVTFAHWKRDFPERIELYLTDPRASGDRSLPSLYWNNSQKKYLPKESDHHE